MKTYKLYIRSEMSYPDAVIGTGDNIQVSFLFDPANTDYANFKKEVLEGAELQDADGNVMSAEQVQEFMKGLV